MEQSDLTRLGELFYTDTTKSDLERGIRGAIFHALNTYHDRFLSSGNNPGLVCFSYPATAEGQLLLKVAAPGWRPDLAGLEIHGTVALADTLLELLEGAFTGIYDGLPLNSLNYGLAQSVQNSLRRNYAHVGNLGMQFVRGEGSLFLKRIATEGPHTSLWDRIFHEPWKSVFGTAYRQRVVMWDHMDETTRDLFRNADCIIIEHNRYIAGSPNKDLMLERCVVTKGELVHWKYSISVAHMEGLPLAELKRIEALFNLAQINVDEKFLGQVRVQ